MQTYEARAYATLARERIAALWLARHSDPRARERVHYWVRVARAFA